MQVSLKAIVKLILVSLLLLYFLLSGLAFAGEVVLSANCTANGRTSSFFNNTGASSYLKITYVDSKVGRLKIENGSNQVIFDDLPAVNSFLYLPPAKYSATVWSSPGSSPAVAVKGTLVSTLPDDRKVVVYAPDNINLTADYVAVGYAPPAYKNYCKPYYRAYYYTHPAVKPKAVTNPAYKNPKSVLAPAYQKNQKSVLDPAYQNNQNSVLDPGYQKSQKSVLDPAYQKKQKSVPDKTPKKKKK